MTVNGMEIPCADSFEIKETFPEYCVHRADNWADMRKMAEDLDALVANQVVGQPIRDMSPVVDAAVRSYMALNWPDYEVRHVFQEPPTTDPNPHFVVAVVHKDDTMSHEVEDAYENFVRDMTAWMTEHQHNGYGYVLEDPATENIVGFEMTEEKESIDDILFSKIS